MSIDASTGCTATREVRAQIKQKHWQGEPQWKVVRVNFKLQRNTSRVKKLRQKIIERPVQPEKDSNNNSPRAECKLENNSLLLVVAHPNQTTVYITQSQDNNRLLAVTIIKDGHHVKG